MTTLERRQHRLSSPMGSRQDNSTYADGTGVPEAADLQQRLAAVSSFTPSVHTRSNHSSKEGNERARNDKTDSGYASIASSPHSDKPQFVAHDPSTKLKQFAIPISEQLKQRFHDIKILYTQPLIDVILKKRSSPGDVSMKLKYLGDSEETARPYIIIQCEKKVSKRVKKFFEQDHVKEELKTDFCVFILDQELLRLASGDAINVLTDFWPEDTLCGMPIKMTRDNTSSIATLGGLVMVETSEKRLYGLTAGHPLKRLGGSHPEMSEMDSDSDSDLDSDLDTDSDSSNMDCEFASSGSIKSVPYSSFENYKARDDESVPNTSIIGKITCHSLSTPTQGNFDWALIDLGPLQLEPNALMLNGLFQTGSHLELEGAGKTITWISSSSDPESASERVIVLTSHGSQSGELTCNGSCLLMSPSSMFAPIYDLTMRATSSLRPGDSGSWVVNEGTSSVYGHVVSVDAFGEGQVMPISLTLESIRIQVGAVRVWLPTREDVRAAMVSCRELPTAQPSAISPTGKDIDPGISSSSLNLQAEARVPPTAASVAQSRDPATDLSFMSYHQWVQGDYPDLSDYGLVAPVSLGPFQPRVLRSLYSSPSIETWAQPQQQQQGPHGQPQLDTTNVFPYELTDTDSGYYSLCTSPNTLPKGN